MMLSQALTFTSAAQLLLSHRTLFGGGRIETPSGEDYMFLFNVNLDVLDAFSVDLIDLPPSFFFS